MGAPCIQQNQLPPTPTFPLTSTFCSFRAQGCSPTPFLCPCQVCAFPGPAGRPLLGAHTTSTNGAQRGKWGHRSWEVGPPLSAVGHRKVPYSPTADLSRNQGHHDHIEQKPPTNPPGKKYPPAWRPNVGSKQSPSCHSPGLWFGPGGLEGFSETQQRGPQCYISSDYQVWSRVIPSPA